ncbi:MAG TPA: ubiquinol oxidase subunit II [Rhodopila sp.]|uniref:ubiquinol oxidase subunit II n=1 Tax=Rhodopila sp. TaxID=2480087 RepID=UPI002CE2C7D9|nr:ubiquinol oxidase subunit II [Rhodopila sp.]HVY13982.1 ubiquinol oxidase subunit II [Rhodopila sp.]
MSRKYLSVLTPMLLMGLSGCKAVVLDPAGDVALQQRNILLESTGLMLLVILPVMALTAWFAWHYRQSNKAARYEPEWDHSTQLELVIWGAPLLIIISLGALTWMSTHLLDPYRPIARIAAGQAVTGTNEPLEVDVVALDWKWLFIYPQYQLATVNELAAPVDRPIDFRVTSSSVMNSFYIPALAGQIYAMPGMETKLHAVSNQTGVFDGFSANYSGAGFSGMHFAFHSMTSVDFRHWVDTVKSGSGSLTRTAYLRLERPSENEPAQSFASVDPTLYNTILNMCVEAGKMCLSEMSAIDARGGLGLQGIRSVLPLEHDKYARRGPDEGPPTSAYVLSPCSVQEAERAAAAPPMLKGPRDLAPLSGAGLSRPGSKSGLLGWQVPNTKTRS